MTDNLDLILLPWHKHETPISGVFVIVQNEDRSIDWVRSDQTSRDLEKENWMYFSDLAAVLRRVEQIEKNHEPFPIPNFRHNNRPWKTTQTANAVKIVTFDPNKEGVEPKEIAIIPESETQMADTSLFLASRLLLNSLCEIIGESDYVKLSPRINREIMDRAINAVILANGVIPPRNPRPNVIRIKGDNHDRKL